MQGKGPKALSFADLAIKIDDSTIDPEAKKIEEEIKNWMIKWME